jgi:hypothetical protein
MIATRFIVAPKPANPGFLLAPKITRSVAHEPNR